MKHFPSLTLVCSLYMVTIMLGLNTALFILPLMYPPQGEVPVIPPIVANPQSIWSSVEILAYVLVATVFMLALMRRGWGFVIQGALFLSIFSGSSFSLTALTGSDLLGLIMACVVLAVAIWKRGNPYVTNTALIFTLSGIGALLGTSLGLVPAALLLVLASIYDFIAVFMTKHMVTLARGGKESAMMMFSIPVGERTMGLGGGDVAFPLALVVSVMAAQGIGIAIPTALGGLLGIISLFYYLLSREGATLPALPPITAGLFIGYAMAVLL